MRVRWLAVIAAAAAFAIVVSQDSWWLLLLRALFPQEAQVLHPRASMSMLVLQHILLVGLSSCLTLLVGLPLGIAVTRGFGRPFLGLVNDITTFGQTFPPVAVLALAVPLMGFGLKPTVLALFLYGLLPVVRNTVAGIAAVPEGMRDAARGLGLTGTQILMRIELPLAARVIIAGVRTSVVINVGTAMIGAVIGAGGLGSPIIAGLIQDNLAFIVQGALPAAILSLLLDQTLAAVEMLVPGAQAPQPSDSKRLSVLARV